MMSSRSRTRLLAAMLVLSAVVLALLVANGGVHVPSPSSDEADEADERPANPTTDGTVGYVEGYWHDEDLPVDDSGSAVVSDDDLEAVVYRSMARVEVIRDLTFDDEVDVEVISREEYQADDGMFINPSDGDRTKLNATYEALFLVDDESDATTELQSMYGGAVQGYYDPATDRIVLVSDTPETPEVNETVLGHELVHALQDQQFDLTNYRGETIDREHAENGLIEGDAVHVEREYAQRCEREWACLEPEGERSDERPEFNMGLYLSFYQPYEDGPDYIEHLRDSDDGWSAVNDAYDDPPTSSSTVIHREPREPVDVAVDDRSDGSWAPLETDGEIATETAGEASMVAMFGSGAFDPATPSVLDLEALLEGGTRRYDYDQPHTNGWTGDELVPYVRNGAGQNPTSTETGYVWKTAWRSDEDAQQFVSGYLELLEINGADPVPDRRDTYVIEDGFAGAYSIEADGETVTIVHAPSVDELDAIADGAAPPGEDTLERTTVEADDSGADDSGADGYDAAGSDSDDEDSIAGVGVPGAVIAISIGVFVARTRYDARRRSVDSESRQFRPIDGPEPNSIELRVEPKCGPDRRGCCRRPGRA